MVSKSIHCYLVDKDAQGRVSAQVSELPLERLSYDGDEVLIRVESSSLNYKDALAATGHPGVVRRFPHVPGIDAAGEVIESSDPTFSPGDKVLVTSYELGAGHWGGWAQYVRVPSAWVVPLPPELSVYDAMALGTAGLTAALSVEALQKHDISPNSGEILVTGSTGGVGCLTVMLLSQLGYQVVASTGKSSSSDKLRNWGASRIVSREDISDPSNKPLLSPRWAGAVDTVGGTTLSNILRELSYGGCVVACGLVGGTDIHTTVYPFLLRRLTLTGVDTANYPMDRRLSVWKKLATSWKLARLRDVTREVELTRVGESVAQILRGEIAGRVVIDVNR